MLFETPVGDVYPHAVRGQVLPARRHPPPPSSRSPGAARAGLDTGAGPVTYLGSLLFAAGDLVLCQGPDMRPPGPAALTFPPHELY